MVVVAAAVAVGGSVSTYVTHLSHHQDSTIQKILNSNRRNDDEGKLTYTSANEKEEEDACMQLSKRKTEH